MLLPVIMQWALLVTYSGYNVEVVYFESKELCIQAKNTIENTRGNALYAKTPCFQVAHKEVFK